jgi:hypothetical protein
MAKSKQRPDRKIRKPKAVKVPRPEPDPAAVEATERQLALNRRIGAFLGVSPRAIVGVEGVPVEGIDGASTIADVTIRVDLRTIDYTYALRVVRITG